MKLNNKIITIDGPSGVGKGTMAVQLAKHFDYDILDSGAIYRLSALSVSNATCDIENQDDISNYLKKLNIHFDIEDGLVIPFLDNKNVLKDIRTERIGMLASKIAGYPKVRQMLFQKQKDFAIAQGLVADGRDMGTIVFPEAKFKIFLDASAQVRSERRYYDLAQRGIQVDINAIQRDIEQRDYQDRNREVAPLMPAKDAVIIDTSNMSIDEVFEAILVYTCDFK